MVARPMLGDRVRYLMESTSGPYAGKSIQDFADASFVAAKEAGGRDFSKPKLEAIRAGRGNTSVAIARTLAHMLECSAAYLFGDTDDPKPEALSAAVVAKRLSDMPAREVERFFDDVAARLIDFRPDTSAEKKSEADTPISALAKSGKVSADPSDMEAFWDSVPHFYKREEARIRGVVFDAASFVGRRNEAETDGRPKEEVRPEAPSIAWLEAFRRYAPAAVEADMARLWASVLAYEFRHPGAIRVRTLMALPGLTPKVLKDLVSFSGALITIESKKTRMGEYFIRPNDDKGPNHYLAMFGLVYDDVLNLEEYGLVHLSHRDIAVFPEDRMIYGSGQDKWSFVLRKKNTIKVNALTDVAKDLRPLYQGRPNEDYLKGVRSGMRKCTTPYRPWS